jgi:RNA polymerase sigma factor (sigma-70 family)
MDGGRLRKVIQRLRRAAAPPGAGGLTDADLLRRWVAHRDEAAFEALLWRHAAAVLGVCRRVLHDAHEAEDAAQAAFLALARKARSIGRRQAVAAWLYTVAYRAALRARSRRPRAAVPLHDLSALPARPAEDPAWRDLRPVLDEEISRLPDRFRAPFVLCHVEGRTNEEAARELGCPVGTVLSRLARARQRLRARLTRRGVTLTAAALTAALAGEAAEAAVPGVLVRTAVAAAALAAAGKGVAGVVSTEVIALAEGVVRAMLLTKVKTAVVVGLGLALLGGGGGVLTYRTVAGEPGAAPQEPAARTQSARPAPADEDKLKTLLAQKEKEVRVLQDRVKVLEDSLQKTTRELQQQREQAQRFQASADAYRNEALVRIEREARQAAEERGRAAEPGRGRPGMPGAGPAPDDPNRITAEHAAQAEQARDEVELLEAQLAIKRAQLDAASRPLELLERAMRSGQAPASEVAAQRGQMEIKAAELREAEVRLAQAKRRLAKLQGASAPAQDEPRQQLGQRAAELEKKLDALKKEFDALRKDLEQQRPGRP